MIISFICLGNICRSPMAEFIMKDLLQKQNLQSKIIIQSAGTSGENDGCDIYPKAAKKLCEKGIKSSDFVSKKLSQKICDESDFIITMDNSNFKNVMSNFKNVSDKTLKITDFADSLGYTEVPDPWYSGDFEETYTILNLACKNLLDFLKTKL